MSGGLNGVERDTAAAAPRWTGDGTSVNEFLRPLREHLDTPGVLEVCVNRPGEILVETAGGWHSIAAPELSLERCLSLATAIATFSDQSVSQEHPLLAATLPTGERIQIVIPPAVTRGTVSITIRKPADAVKHLDDLEREGLFRHAATVGRAPSSTLSAFERELAAL